MAPPGVVPVPQTVSGPPIGGAKSGINFNPNDPRKKGVLERWYHAVSPLLKSYYGTGGDLNVDENDPDGADRNMEFKPKFEIDKIRKKVLMAYKSIT